MGRAESFSEDGTSITEVVLECDCNTFCSGLLTFVVRGARRGFVASSNFSILRGSRRIEPNGATRGPFVLTPLARSAEADSEETDDDEDSEPERIGVEKENELPDPVGTRRENDGGSSSEGTNAPEFLFGKESEEADFILSIVLLGMNDGG